LKAALLRWIRELLNPALRRARRKRELEVALRDAGVSRVQALRAVHAYFSSCSQRANNGK
jgi:hypothetical protein